MSFLLQRRHRPPSVICDITASSYRHRATACRCRVTRRWHAFWFSPMRHKFETLYGNAVPQKYIARLFSQCVKKYQTLEPNVCRAWKTSYIHHHVRMSCLFVSADFGGDGSHGDTATALLPREKADASDYRYDVGDDIDDALAILVAAAMHRVGVIKIVAAITSGHGQPECGETRSRLIRAVSKHAMSPSSWEEAARNHQGQLHDLR